MASNMDMESSDGLMDLHIEETITKVFGKDMENISIVKILVFQKEFGKKVF